MGRAEAMQLLPVKILPYSESIYNKRSCYNQLNMCLSISGHIRANLINQSRPQKDLNTTDCGDKS
jgi:hypothetical protein